MPDPDISKIPLSSIRPGPIRHESLSDELLERIRVIFKLIGPYLDMNLEQFELGFMRDAHPDNEVAIWARIAAAWHTYHKNFTDLKRLPDEEEKGLVKALLLTSMGIDDPAKLGVDVQTAARLKECYEMP